MSMIICHTCERYIDTDFDTESHHLLATYSNQAHPVNPAVEEPEIDIWLCGSCRDHYGDENGFFHPNGAPFPVAAE